VKARRTKGNCTPKGEPQAPSSGFRVLSQVVVSREILVPEIPHAEWKRRVDAKTESPVKCVGRRSLQRGAYFGGSSRLAVPLAPGPKGRETLILHELIQQRLTGVCTDALDIDRCAPEGDER
jgi:hypothetical protein